MLEFVWFAMSESSLEVSNTLDKAQTCFKKHLHLT